MSGSAQPRFSIIVPTINRTAGLLTLLDSLPGEGAVPFEVVIIDQNGNDEVAEALRQRDYQFPINHLRTANLGANKARNTGAAHARHEWLAFTDDDVEYRSETLQVASDIIRTEQPLALSGIFINREHHGHSNSSSFFARPGLRTRHRMLGPVHEPVLFMRRDTFHALGGFDETFGPAAPFPSTEGVELFARLLRSMPNARAYFAPQVVVYHPFTVPPWNERAAQRFYTYAYGSGAFLAKHCYPPHTIEYSIRVLKMALMMLRSNGIRRTCYRRWLAGFFAGFRAYRAWQREGAPRP